MMQKKNLFLMAILGSLLFFPLCAFAQPAESFRDKLEGLVYETEEWSEPKDAWVKDQSPDNKWCLWTTEEDVWKKRSGGQSLKTPSVQKDRATPEEGAPPLHTKITGIPNGCYRAFMGPTNRMLAISFDGKNWEPASTTGEVNLGIFDITDGVFELYVDDRYANPNGIGSAYYDYIRFVVIERLVLTDLTAFTLPNGDTQLSWISSIPMEPANISFGFPGGSLQEVTEEFTLLRNHLVILSGLDKGKEYTAQIRSPLSRKGGGFSSNISFIAGERPTPPSSQSNKIRLTINEPTKAARQHWPVTSGVPFAKGALANIADVRLTDESGQPLPAQFEVSSYWPDGSVKWLVVDFLADTKKDSSVCYYLETGPNLNPESSQSTGSSVATKPEPPLVPFVATERLTSQITLADGQVLKNQPEPFQWETKGNLRESMVSEGDYLANDGSPMFRWRCHLTSFPQTGLVRLRWQIGNNQTEKDHTLLRSAWVTVQRENDGAFNLLSEKKDSSGGLDASRPLFTLTGGESAQREFTVLQDLEKRATFKLDNNITLQEQFDGFVQSGKQAVWVRDFWQTWPKGLSCRGDKIQYYLLPTLPKNNYPPENWTTLDETFMHFYWYKEGAWQFKRGMEVANELWLISADTSLEGNANWADWMATPLFAVADPEYYCSTGTFPPVSPRREGVFDVYEKSFDDSFKNLEQGRVNRGEYGWMNFGDWFGERRWNWGNNEYDLTYTCAMQFIRTGNTDFLNRAIEMTRHYTTIDFIAWPWIPRTRELLYAHSTGHVGGFIEKDDPRLASEQRFVANLAGGVDGSGGHSHQPGSFYIGCLTGDKRIFHVAEQACTAQARYYTTPAFRFSIERAAGWAMINATNAYLFTGNPYYLNAAKLYFTAIKETQNAETGCFDLPQDQSECDCPDKKDHRGGKAFAVGVLLHGLARYYELTGDEEVKQSIVRCADWLIDISWNEEKQGFRYKTGCPKYEDSGSYSVIVTEGIAYAGELTGNPRYIDFLARTLVPELRRASGANVGAGKDFAQRNRQLPHALYYLQKQSK